MPTAIVWFRRDLRVHDHPALSRAISQGFSILAVYIHSPEELAPWGAGAASQWWLHHSLRALDGTLRSLGSRLILRHGPSKDALLGLAKESKAGAVFCSRQWEPGAIARDSGMRAALQAERIAFEALPGSTLHEHEEVRTQDGQPYRVFTPFWNRIVALEQPINPLPAPHKLMPPEIWPSSLTLDDLGLLPKIPWYQGFESAWTPGESGARRRLDAFCDSAAERYAEQRDLPGTNGTSRLSPHLAFGEVSPRQIWRAIRRAVPEGAATPFLRQIGWREFAQHLLFHFPRSVDHPLRAEFARMSWRKGADSLLKAWQRGRTGIPIIDAGMRELWATGWMHNRVRMLVASFLTKNARIPWQTGARWFWDTLVDADLANNSMGWQWVAGSGTDAAPYFRIFNPVTQGKRFDPEGSYVRRWVPELSALPSPWIHEPWSASPIDLAAGNVRLGETYPYPVLDLTKTRVEALAAYEELRRR